MTVVNVSQSSSEQDQLTLFNLLNSISKVYVTTGIAFCCLGSQQVLRRSREVLPGELNCLLLPSIVGSTQEWEEIAIAVTKESVTAGREYAESAQENSGYRGNEFARELDSRLTKNRAVIGIFGTQIFVGNSIIQFFQNKFISRIWENCNFALRSCNTNYKESANSSKERGFQTRIKRIQIQIQINSLNQTD